MKKKEKKPYLVAVVTGILSAVSYYVLFTHPEVMTGTFNKGGYHAIYPILTVLYISLVYGTFASSILSIMGLQAAKSGSKH